MIGGVLLGLGCGLAIILACWPLAWFLVDALTIDRPQPFNEAYGDVAHVPEIFTPFHDAGDTL
jgi:hypothetical protein